MFSCSVICTKRMSGAEQGDAMSVEMALEVLVFLIQVELAQLHGKGCLFVCTSWANCARLIREALMVGGDACPRLDNVLSRLYIYTHIYVYTY